MHFCVASQSMILEQEFGDASDWKGNLTTCQILKETFEIESEFENKWFGKSRFELLYSMRTTFCRFIVSSKRKVLNQKSYDTKD